MDNMNIEVINDLKKEDVILVKLDGTESVSKLKESLKSCKSIKDAFPNNYVIFIPDYISIEKTNKDKSIDYLEKIIAKLKESV